MSFLKLLASVFLSVFQPTSVTVDSNAGNDITGTDHKDTIFGRGGDDTISGGGGNDKLFGGSGNDTLDGGSGNDYLNGSRGNDVLNGGSGNDHIDGRSGNDTINGGDGYDLIHGGSGHDVIYGGAGNDRLFGQSGNDKIYGGSGNDSIDGGSGDDTLDGGSGSDKLLGGAGNDTAIYTMAENAGAKDVYEGGSGKDTLVLRFTHDEWMRADVQRDIAKYLDFLEDHTGRNGQADCKDFKFTAFGLTASEFESLKVVVDGVELDPRDQAVTAVNDVFTSAAEDAVVTGNVLANDIVPDLVKSVVLVHGPQVGALTLNNDGTFSYNPGQAFNSLGAGETATQTFTYKVTDADGDTSTACVTIKITGTNDAPVAAVDSVTAVEDTAIVIPAATLLANDQDADAHDHLAIQAVGGAVGGSVALNSAGNVVFTPAANFSGDASFTYTVSDGHGGLSQAAVTVHVSAVADAPQLTVHDVTGEAGQTVTLDIAAALTDTDGSEVMSILLSGLPEGSLLSAGTANADGTYTLLPADLAGLHLTPPSGTSGDLSLTVTATSHELSNGSTATTTAAFLVTLPEISHEPTFGDDMLMGTDGDDSIDGLGGNDTIFAGGGDDEVIGGDGNNVVAGGDGDDSVDLGNGNNDVSGDNGDDYILLGSGDNVAHGGSGDDTLDAMGGNNQLYGDEGDDAIFAGNGNNHVYGGDGDDDIEVGDGNNHVDGGNGDDLIFAGDGNNTLLGGDGDDDISAGDGDNYVDGGDGDDFITLGGGHNVVFGGAGDDDIYAADGDNTLDGGADNDILETGAGNDVLIGGLGHDRLTGGDGNDVFIYNSPDDSGIGALTRDVITDFDAGSNTTAVDQLDFSSFAVGAFEYLGDDSHAFTADGNTQAHFNNQTKILEVDADGDSHADMQIQLQGVDAANLDHNDFITQPTS